ncbi:hypothetical protein [Phocicoccus pinnipedialis]|uniref:Tubby C 2 n=1 Tax=Phocicoccus pinnipedialis TaxID=110845 RepID=A0A6V7RPH8_9BACL|nr:hypothetical protein [Jeotgalicoccus pinnipedialis]MBP1940236.1 hypothetical protein [Jeotgalicoccus pinnipedialis]CAD2079563.1 hypothetical protein JEOPIN946_01590 [Jeotgalicoccus pinnipedialis]
MRHYYWELDKRHNKRNVYITDEADNRIGEVKLSNEAGFDEKNSYTFTFKDNDTYFLGLKKRRFKDMNVARYRMIFRGEKFKLRERKIHNIMNFRVDGIINETLYVFKENATGVVEMIKNNTIIGRITDDEIVLNDNAERYEISVLIMMYFMFKLYKREDIPLKKYL